jgi:hypothetical protein
MCYTEKSKLGQGGNMITDPYDTYILMGLIISAAGTFGGGIIKALEYAVEYHRVGAGSAAKIDKEVLLEPLRNKSITLFILSGILMASAITFLSNNIAK